jgi:hypothetical protein
MYVRRRYKKTLSGNSCPPDVDIYIFDSMSYNRVRAFTTVSTGANLPGFFAPWEAMGSSPYEATWGLADAVINSLRDRGFFILGGG